MSETRKEIEPYEYINYFFKEDGFLVSMTKKGVPNVMALAWKSIGELWHLPVIIVAVAPSRYTFELLTKEVQEFSVNIPSAKNVGAVMIAGSSSGRNVNKFKEAGLEIIEGKKIKVPTIKDCILSYECKIVHSCKSGTMASHHLFFGHIQAAYASLDIL
ncbi:MAG: flavin reductase family protein [Promethearchaeota archaeon]